MRAAIIGPAVAECLRELGPGLRCWGRGHLELGVKWNAPPPAHKTNVRPAEAVAPGCR